MNTKIFKAYDIRGIYPEDLDEEAAYKIGAAFAIYIKKVSAKDNPQIAVGRDNRLSSNSLFTQLSKGIISQGVDVINIGLSATPTLYFAVANYNYDGGINVTASHNPKQYNGFKMVRERGISLSETLGIGEVKELALSDLKPVKVEGRIIEKDVIEDYVLANKDKENFNIKIIVDTANSVSGVLIPQILNQTNLTHVFSELDGNFPNHEPDPSKKENVEGFEKKVIEGGFDLGIAFDGDGDRVFFVDEKGEVVSSDLILSLVSSIILRADSNNKISCDLRCSNIARETIESLGGEAIMSKVGHSFIKILMKDKDIYFGGEYTGHYYLRQGNAYYEAPYFAIFKVLKEMKESGKKISELVEPFKKYYHSGEINFKVENKEEIIKKIESKYSDGKILTLDGVRIDFNDWWVSIRSSNTEPILRLIVEAKTKEKMEEKVKEIQQIIQAQ